jgi:DNA repair photolyase
VKPIRGRGATENPANRFEQISYEADPEAFDPDAPLQRTQFLKDTTSSIITFNDSPDLGYEASVNPYRGCEHGCAYCYARPYHEFLGFSAGLDFETKIMVKENAPELLRRELASRKWKPQMIAMSGVTDCYQPAERRFEITRRCLEVLVECRNPVSIVTKNFLVTRDIDLLQELARFNAAAVILSITTLDAKLARELEPRTSPPPKRLEAISALAKAGVPTGVNVAPVIPGLTDHEMISIVKAAADAGATFAGYQALRLPYGVKDIFTEWLAQHVPQRKEKVLAFIRSMRGGKLNDSTFGARMRGEGVWAEQMRKMFRVACRKTKPGGFPELSAAAYRRPGDKQTLLSL